MRLLYLIGLGYIAICTALYVSSRRDMALVVVPSTSLARTHQVAQAQPGDAAGWFAQVKPFCNVVEVETQLRRQPPPAGWQGAAYAAGCLALAGRIELARERILGADAGERGSAADIVFEIGHPVADAGDDKSAGPIMELVVEFRPEHYMALYHAGAAEFALKQPALARDHLTAFLKYYQQQDGWTSSARGMLDKLNGVP